MIDIDRSVMSMCATDSKKDNIRSVLSYSSLGIEMGLSVAIGIAIGYFLDKYFETYPVLSIIFMLFGVAASFKVIFRVLKQSQKEEHEGNNSKRN